MKTQPPKSESAHAKRPASTAHQSEQPFFGASPTFFGGGVIQKQEAPFFEGASKNTPQAKAPSLPESVAPLPEPLKSQIEANSGMSMDHVKVHYQSAKPAQLQALAYTQGSDIYVAPGQEKHLPHEAWHVVQQAQGRVKPTMQMKTNLPLNDDQGLEQEADKMGEAASQGGSTLEQISGSQGENKGGDPAVVQRYKDVHAVKFHQAGEMDFEWHKSGYLEKFSQIQVFLNDIKRINNHLHVLNYKLNRFNSNLSDLIAMLMPEWSSQMVTLINPTPRDAFVEMAQSGKLFEDYVDSLTEDNRFQHGIQSHRIQWYLIREEFGPIAFDLFKSAVDPIWLHRHNPTLTMWDLIVDGGDKNPHDFTRPGNLQNYLDFEYESPHGQPNLIRSNMKAEKADFTETKKRLNKEKKEQMSREQQKPSGAKTDAKGNLWSGWINDSETPPWAPTILEVSEDLGSKFEKNKVTL